MMQIKLDVIKFHQNPVPPLGDVLIVQRLVDVAHEVNDELGGDQPVRLAQRRVQELRGVVLDGRDHAALGLAVALVDDAAVGRGVVLGVDVVQRAGELAPFCVPH